MTAPIISVPCACGKTLQARAAFAGTRADCPYCGRTLQIPEQIAAPPPHPERDAPLEITEFLDPPAHRRSPAPAHPPAEPSQPLAVRMLEAMLDPRSIQWMLMIGGGAAVLGLLIWLVSLGLFRSPEMIAVVLGLGSLAILGAGWWLNLRTRFRVAGQALTFLGCVVLPLNLWFWEAQKLMTLDEHLWIGGLICCVLYGATVFLLKDPLFLYAVEAGTTLTVLLILGDVGYLDHTTHVTLVLLVLGLGSIHLERAFDPDSRATFSRERYGMPFFWSGHLQLATGLGILLATQAVGILIHLLYLTGGVASRELFLGYNWVGNPLIDDALFAGTLWLIGAYCYLYSDLFVRRVGIYTYLAAICVIAAEITIAGSHLSTEGLIALLAVTALAANVFHGSLLTGHAGDASYDKISRAVLPMSVALCALPVLMGIVLHLRATSLVIREMDIAYETGWDFVGAMLLVAICNRISAYLCQHRIPRLATSHFFFSAAGLIVAAAGMLRLEPFYLRDFTQQAPLLLLIPIGYLIASHLWHGRPPEWPLYWVAQTATAVLLWHVVMAGMWVTGGEIQTITHHPVNLRLGIAFAEAALFYGLATAIRRRSANVFLATASGCMAVWQLFGYAGIPVPYYTMVYAVLGLVLLIISLVIGVESVKVYGRDGTPANAVRGPGQSVWQAGSAVLGFAILISLLQGIGQVVSSSIEWHEVLAVILTTAVTLVAMLLSPTPEIRRVYMAAAVALAGLTFLMLNVLVDLTAWQKLEIFGAVAGVVLIVGGMIGRFREGESEDESVSTALWLGSLLATGPLFIAMFWHRTVGAGPSLPDELALLTITLLMVVTGCSWQVKSTTIFGTTALVLYLLILIGQLAYRPQIAIGVYLALGGLAVFLLGVLLSIYRDWLLSLPGRITRREGLFRVMTWR